MSSLELSVSPRSEDSGSLLSSPPHTANAFDPIFQRQLGGPLGGMPTAPANKPLSKAARRVNTAERRATHNAIERARRETLNTRFYELARCLPALADVRRPSKSAIVNKSIEFVYAAQRREKQRIAQLALLNNESETLRAEINKLRERLGIQPLEPRQIMPLDEMPVPMFSSSQCQSDTDEDSIINQTPPHLSLPLGQFSGLNSGKYSPYILEDGEDDLRDDDEEDTPKQLFSSSAAFASGMAPVPIPSQEMFFQPTQGLPDFDPSLLSVPMTSAPMAPPVGQVATNADLGPANVQPAHGNYNPSVGVPTSMGALSHDFNNFVASPNLAFAFGGIPNNALFSTIPTTF